MRVSVPGNDWWTSLAFFLVSVAVTVTNTMVVDFFPRMRVMRSILAVLVRLRTFSKKRSHPRGAFAARDRMESVRGERATCRRSTTRREVICRHCTPASDALLRDDEWQENDVNLV